MIAMHKTKSYYPMTPRLPRAQLQVFPSQQPYPGRCSNPASQCGQGYKHTVHTMANERSNLILHLTGYPENAK